MRLINYLTESNKQAKGILNIIFKSNLSQELLKIKSDNELLHTLDYAFATHDISFEHGQQTKVAGNSLILYAQITSDGDLVIFLKKKGVLKYLQDKIKDNTFNDIKKNVFFRELYLLLVHELIHVRQFEKNPDLFKNIPKVNDMKEYLSDKDEIDAYSAQAVEEVRMFGKSKVITMYLTIFDKDDPIIDKLLKRINYYEEHS
jgi:hypothetical protein